MSVVLYSRVSVIGAVIGTVVLTVAAIFGWFSLAASARALFTDPQVATLVLFLLGMDAFILLMACSTVRADERGLKVRNGLRPRYYPWAEVAAISYRRSDPWANLVLKSVGDHDSPRQPMLGIQRVDGQRASQAVATLRGLLQAGTATPDSQ